MTAKGKVYTNHQKRIAMYARALGHPARIFILDFLAENPDKSCYSGDMAEELPVARSTLSQHLKELKDAGLIQGEIKPPYIKYSINRDNWTEARSMFKSFFKKVDKTNK